MYNALLVFYFFITFCLVTLILFQPGKGGIMGATEGGASAMMMGVSGSVAPITKLCRVFAALFMIVSLLLGRYGPRVVQQASDKTGQLFCAGPGAQAHDASVEKDHEQQNAPTQ